jgi:signal transduction histidine kinase
VQASATRHRALALDAQRERDLISSLREELEARYAETLHEIRSAALALEGGMHVFGGAESRDKGTLGTLSDSLIAELHRLREIANPEHADAQTEFRLAEALDPLVALSDVSGGSVQWTVPRDLVVQGRPNDVTQIVHGLLSNAAKYAPGGGVDVSVKSAARFVLVLVDDYGPGIRAAHRERIFERGERSEDTASKEGHGLGLHIGRQLARSLGGELWVEQNPRGGARFVLALRAGTAVAVQTLERSAS